MSPVAKPEALFQRAASVSPKAKQEALATEDVYQLVLLDIQEYQMAEAHAKELRTFSQEMPADAPAAAKQAMAEAATAAAEHASVLEAKMSKKQRFKQAFGGRK
jgi:hypothetical protein